eukprot:COSAG04_NODE_1034_length_8611_cov_4.315672_6_plen_471_part_00
MLSSIVAVLLLFPSYAISDGFTFVSVSRGDPPEPLTGRGLDSVAAANDGSGILWACGHSGTLEGFSVAVAGKIDRVYHSGAGEVPGCSALTFLHGPKSDRTGSDPLIPGITGLVAATDRGLVAYNITSRGPEKKLGLTRTSDVPPPTAGAVTAIRLFRHFKSLTPGEVDADSLIVAASDRGELFAANVSGGGSLRVASGTLPVGKLVNASAGGAALPAVGGFSRWDFMGISMFLGVTFSSGSCVLNAVQVSGHDNLEPEDPSTWGVRGLPKPILAPASFPHESGCGDTVEHNDLIYIACSGANAILAVSLESNMNPVFNIPFPGKHARGLLLVGDALFVGGGNDVAVYDLSKVRPDSQQSPPVLVGRCGAACATILGKSTHVANAHGMAYRYDTKAQTHNLVISAAFGESLKVPRDATATHANAPHATRPLNALPAVDAASRACGTTRIIIHARTILPDDVWMADRVRVI